MAGPDPAPLTTKQLRALSRAAGRELGWGLRLVTHEVAAWRAVAWSITDTRARTDALADLETKRSYVNGAAFLWTLPSRRRPELVRLLVAFQVLANLLDAASENDARQHGMSPNGWTTAIVNAVDLRRTSTQRADAIYNDDPAGNYFALLVDACRSSCATLPRYDVAYGPLTTEARRGMTMDLEHDPDRHRRLDALHTFAAREFGERSDLTWWELTAGSTSLITPLVALALAGDQEADAMDVRNAVEAYRWVATLCALLDNYLDQADDYATSMNNYTTMYPSPAVAVDRIATVTDRAVREVSALRHGERHVVIVSSMIAMFLSNDNARHPTMRVSSQTLTHQGGSLTRALLPVLRLRRLLYRRPTD